MQLLLVVGRFLHLNRLMPQAPVAAPPHAPSLRSRLLPALLPAAALAASGEVRVVQNPDGGWSLQRDGKPFVVRGAGGRSHLDTLVEIGGNTIRTWGIEELKPDASGRSLLDAAHERGLTVMAGIWVQHERHGFSYDDPAQIERQREHVRAAVRAHKDHPALLLWGLGNEMEGPSSDGQDPRIWRELEHLARIVREEDPHHPVCTVIAGANPAKIRALMRDYPSLEILGINAYGGAAAAGQAVVEAGWTKPFLLAEYGPLGHWEVRHTPWGAPVEPSSKDKAANYYASHRGAMEDGQGQCLGTFAFVWGHKQETTSTWYGMFLASGEKLPPVDAVAYAWNGRWPANRCPRLEHFDAAFIEGTVSPGAELNVRAVLQDPEAQPLSLEWQVVAESTDRKTGGDHEEAPPAFPECVLATEGHTARLRAPEKPGAYRVFLFVRDGHGGATTGNFPFLVK